MKIVFALHDFSLTGAPKLGLQIAEIFAQGHEVTLVTKKDGPLRDLINFGSFSDVINVETSHEISNLTLEERINRASDVLKEIDPDIVYVNSIAAGDWVSAARRNNYKVVLHVHELQRSIIELQRIKLFDNYDISQVDLVVAASDECMQDVWRMFRFPVDRVINFGVCVNIEEIQSMAGEVPPMATRHDGGTLEWNRVKRNNRKLVAMCGQSCHRKGTDLFWQAALGVPEHDFLWVGPWDDEVSKLVNPALSLNRERPLSNLYWTNLVKNPFSCISQSDLFVLTAREDPNPLVVPEAISLGLPVLTFRNSGGSHYWTSRYGYSLTGDVDPKRISDFIHRYFSMSHDFNDVNKSFFEMADLKSRTLSMMKDLERISSSY